MYFAHSTEKNNNFKICLRLSVSIFYFFPYLELTLSRTVEWVYFVFLLVSFPVYDTIIHSTRACPWSCFSNSGDGFTWIAPHSSVLSPLRTSSCPHWTPGQLVVLPELTKMNCPTWRLHSVGPRQNKSKDVLSAILPNSSKKPSMCLNSKDSREVVCVNSVLFSIGMSRRPTFKAKELK